MVPPIGLVKKIMKLRGEVCLSNLPEVHRQKEPDELSNASTVPVSACGLPATGSKTSNAGSSVSKSSEIQIPLHWRPEVEQCIVEQSLDQPARNEINRTLVSLLFSRHTKPTRELCGALARRLILQYSFMKDDMGNGYVSPLN